MENRTYLMTRVPSAPCAGCGKDLSAATGRGNPKPGDLCLCIDCGTLHNFDRLLKVKPMSADAEAALPDATKREIEAVRQRIRRAALHHSHAAEAYS